MESVRDRILAAAVAALNAGTPPCQSFRSRTSAFAMNELPARVVYPVNEAPERAGANVCKRSMTLRVEVMTAGAAPQDETLDPLLVDAVKRLSADATFQALLEQFDEDRVAWQIEPAEMDIACAAVDFRVVYAHAPNDPETQVQLVAGYSGRVYVSDDDGVTYPEVGGLSDVELAMQSEVKDDSNFDSPGKAQESSVGFVSWTATAGALSAPNDVALAKIVSAMMNGQTLKFRFDFDGTGAGKKRFSGDGVLASWKLSSRASDVAAESLQIQGSGLLSVVTQ